MERGPLDRQVDDLVALVNTFDAEAGQQVEIASLLVGAKPIPAPLFVGGKAFVPKLVFHGFDVGLVGARPGCLFGVASTQGGETTAVQVGAQGDRSALGKRFFRSTR